MVEKLGVLVVSYGAREAAIVDVLTRSDNYRVDVYVADKQRNPFNAKTAAKHVVIPDLNVNEICRFAKVNKDKVSFGIVGPEKPIIDGVRDLVEEQTGIPMICPTKEYAIEASKVEQRLLFEKIVPEANPRFKIFDPKDFKNVAGAKRAVYQWLDEIENRAVVKPDRPTAGKGVGVWGDHFFSRDQLFEYFLSNFRFGTVIVEEKVDGEESSFQAFCDGKHLAILPDTRDYKRAFDGDRGPNTGGMGSYKNSGDSLPFLSSDDRAQEMEMVRKIFRGWRGKDGSGLRGIPLYMAFMHTGRGPKILENNSRPGDPEIINILPILKQDFVDVCYRILEENLTRIEVDKTATVVTYKAPPGYAGYADSFPNLVKTNEIGTPVDLVKANELSKKYDDRIRIYPAAMEEREGKLYPLTSRAVAVLGVGQEIEVARQISVEGIEAISGGGLWYRTDIASEQHIDDSKKHMEKLRSKQ
jgi:phosphoribosylamine--glycine ligase